MLPHVKGRLLDVGCGCNNLVLNYRRLCGGEGIGVDVFAWPNADLVVKNTSKLAFQRSSFDTVAFLACLNHIPYREAALKEAARVLKKGGRVLITMISEGIGEFWHKVPEKLWGERKKGRSFDEDEKGGLNDEVILDLLKKAGFRLIKIEKFQFGFNKLYIAEKIK